MKTRPIQTVTVIIEIETAAPIRDITRKAYWEFWSGTHPALIKQISAQVADATKPAPKPKRGKPGFPLRQR